MLQYELAAITPVIVTLDSTDPNIAVKIEYQGSDDAIAQVKPVLESSYGAFGHIIGETTTPIDLDAAMRSPDLENFYPQLLQGEDLVKKYDPKIPEGSIT